MFPWLPLNNPICPTGAVVRGIDVSVYQGTIDWAKVKVLGRGVRVHPRRQRRHARHQCPR